MVTLSYIIREHIITVSHYHVRRTLPMASARMKCENEIRFLQNHLVFQAPVSPVALYLDPFHSQDGQPFTLAFTPQASLESPIHPSPECMSLDRGWTHEDLENSPKQRGKMFKLDTDAPDPQGIRTQNNSSGGIFAVKMWGNRNVHLPPVQVGLEFRGVVSNMHLLLEYLPKSLDFKGFCERQVPVLVFKVCGSRVQHVTTTRFTEHYIMHLTTGVCLCFDFHVGLEWHIMCYNLIPSHHTCSH